MPRFNARVSFVIGEDPCKETELLWEAQHREIETAHVDGWLYRVIRELDGKELPPKNFQQLLTDDGVPDDLQELQSFDALLRERDGIKTSAFSLTP